MLPDQNETCPARFFNYNCLRNPVTIGTALAINDAEQSSCAQRLARVHQEAHRLCDFMIGLQEQDGVNAFRRQQRIVFFPEYRANVR